jgi:hypothetical protein
MSIMKNIWDNRYTYAQYLAIAATGMNVFGFLLIKIFGSDSIGALLVVLGILLALCAYCLGGLWTAIKSALNIAKWGWLVVPFPYDLATGPIAFLIALVAFFLLPIIPVSKANQEFKTQKYIAHQIR